ncbi:MAG TPA: hypothetical protein VF221_23665 [Chloroflexota bacterium]
MDEVARVRLEETLAQTNSLLPAALDANRAGRLTPEQARRLARKDRTDRTLLVLVGLVVILGASLYLGREISHRGLQVLPDEGGAYLGLAVGVLLVGFGVFWREYQTDLTEASVEMVEGRGTREMDNMDDGPPSYSYIVGGVGFAVPEPAYQAFVDGLSYRAYYLPHAGQLVNIEVLRPEDRPVSTGLPACPVCGRSDRVANVFADYPALNERTGCSGVFFPFNLILPVLQGRNLLREGQERLARQRARLAARAHRPPLYRCRRDEVVFVPGTGKAMPVADLVRRLRAREDPETIAQSFTTDRLS